MHPHLRKLIDTRPPGNPDTAEFLKALGDPQAAEAFREAMREEASSSTTEEQQLTPDELALALAAEVRLRDTKEKKDLATLKADYLAWAREFKLGRDNPEQWIAETFTFNPDGTVAVEGGIDLSSRKITHLPRGLTRVNGRFILSSNRLTSLESLPREIYGFLALRDNDLTSLDGLPQVIHGDLSLTDNPLTSLEGLRGKKIDGNLYLEGVTSSGIPEGIELGAEVFVRTDQTALKQDAIDKGYRVHE